MVQSWWGEGSFAPSKVVESEIQEHQEVCQFEYCFAHPSVVFHGEPAEWDYAKSRDLPQVYHILI